jgi:hypothetical protein
MLKRFLGLAILSSFLLPHGIALAQEQWTEVVTNAVGDRFLVDQSSVRTQDNSVWYWEYRDFRQPNNAFIDTEIDQPVYGAMMYQSVDCVAGVARLRRLTVFGADRQVINRFDYGDTGSLFQPDSGSSAAAVLRYVCAQRETAPPTQPQ